MDNVNAMVIPTILMRFSEFNFVYMYCWYYPDCFRMCYTLGYMHMPPSYLFSYYYVHVLTHYLLIIDGPYILI